MDEASRRYTPAVIDQAICLARVWNSGTGGQCGRKRTSDVFCHLHTTKWQVHGRVDGPVPESKLREFEKVSPWSEEQLANRRAQRRARAAKEAVAAPTLTEKRAGAIQDPPTSVAALRPATAPANYASAPGLEGSKQDLATQDAPRQKTKGGRPAGIKNKPKVFVEPPGENGEDKASEKISIDSATTPASTASVASIASASTSVLDVSRKRKLAAPEDVSAPVSSGGNGESSMRPDAALTRAQMFAAPVDILLIYAARWIAANTKLRELAGQLERGQVSKDTFIEQIVRHQLEDHRVSTVNSRKMLDPPRKRRANAPVAEPAVASSSTVGTSSSSSAKAIRHTPSVPKDDKKPVPKCTCGCPIHTERCKLFNPGRSFAYTTKFIAQRRPPMVSQQPRPMPPLRPPLPKAPEVNNLSPWATQQVTKIVSEVNAQPITERKAAYKRFILQFHPDKRHFLDSRWGADGRSEAELSEVFMDIKQRYDEEMVKEQRPKMSTPMPVWAAPRRPG